MLRCIYYFSAITDNFAVVRLKPRGGELLAMQVLALIYTNEQDAQS